MANGAKALRKIQLGRNADSDSDDVIAATTIWRGTGSLEDTRNLYFVAEDVGLLSGTDRTNTSKYGGALALDPIEATPEQLLHLLEMNIKTAAPVADSADAYVSTYAFPTTAGNTFKPYTIEGGDNAGAEVMNYCFGQDFSFAGNEGESWMMGGNVIGKTIVPQAFTGALSLPTVTPLNFGMSKIYIDNDSDTIGTTLVSNTLLQASFAYKSGLVPKFTADGSLGFGFVQSTMFDAQLKVTFEHNASAISEKAAWRAETARLLRVLAEGTVFTNPSSTYARRQVMLNLPGKWLDFSKLGERNGNDVVEGTFQVRYNATYASAGSVVVVHSLSAIP